MFNDNDKSSLKFWLYVLFPCVDECLHKTPSSLRATEMERITTPNSPMYPYAPRILLAGSDTKRDNIDEYSLVTLCT